mmetsp:Transcript_9165/g.17837  ORF Transcript_9165/g.17837 Transcript_9165/m.17837 type:complete len:87 (-) Transcript_9165:5-265(-)
MSLVFVFVYFVGVFCLPSGERNPRASSSFAAAASSARVAECLECWPGVAAAVTPSLSLDALCGKYAHRMHQLKELQKTLAAPALRV